MNVQDLRELLEGFDPKAEVRFADQPGWPMEHTIARDLIESDDETVVYLIAGNESSYLPDSIARQAW